ncbi:exonuclease domain-containing protein [Amycolatopsis sp. NBC_01307]|uniref:3'-5' exonuclease n=1 Tax=Amycolatopsis sp. NBC_01307 TaxID=2903561 RepID=UPI002E12F0A8|nr:exonuclease domain-containing protein [Amycolatopsis sp. NBC_01307]
MASLLNVVDVEATCWAGEPPAGQASEIIEIGLTVVDPARRARLDRHRILVRPERSAVGAFCTELTGLTQADVDAGVSFAEACRILASEHATTRRGWASWGDYDRRQFERQCAADPATYPFGLRHLNAKARFARAYRLARPVGMDRALAMAGLPLEGRHHRGDDDAWNVSALVLHLIGRGAWPQHPHK